MEIWNEAFTGRGSVQLRHSSPLERYAFAKPYFDPAGLIVAIADGKRVGFVHAGFGPNSNETQLAHTGGVTCLVGVRPPYRRQGIATELLARSEAYLRQQGARTLYAGQHRPLNPFYYGLYGGSEMPGLLASDPAVGPFFEKRGYQSEATFLVLQRSLDQPLGITDGRFATIRRRFEVKAMPRMGTQTWWQECTLGPLEMLEFRLVDTLSGQPIARAELWEMEGFSWRWGLPAVGLVELTVRETFRRQAMAKFLVASILRYLQEQYFGLIEVQIPESNQAALRLFQGLAFQQVDVGRVYRKTS